MRKHFLILAGIAVVAAGCGETKLIGTRQLPDETKVVDGPSLALPPDFDLRPPSKAEDYEAVLRAQKTVEARNVITGVSGTTNTVGAVPTPAVGEPNWLVQQAGTAQGDIREQLEREAAQAQEEEKKDTFWNRIMGKKSSDEE
jgi:hypothetical protein